MQKADCLGCKTSFEQGTKLPLEDLVIELKNYTFPIRDQKHKWILLKTIVSLLNSKGGTIFVGAEDKTGEIVGMEIARKEQDEFKLFIQKLAEKIQPPLDLSNREDVIVQFLPLTRNGVFIDKYLGKIIVKQGQTSKLYCFSQKIALQSVSQRKYDEFEVVYSFKRINMGSVKQISGYQLVMEAANRAVNPPKAVNIFHEGCNPEPPKDYSVSYSLSPKQKPVDAPQAPTSFNLVNQNENQYVIQFFRLRDLEARQKLQDKLDSVISRLGAKNYNMSYEQQSDTLVLQFNNKSDWEKVMDQIDTNLAQFNQQFKGGASFVKKQAQADYAVYENQRPLVSRCASGQVCQIKDVSLEKSSQKQKISGKGEQKLEVSPPKVMNRSDSLEKQIKEKDQQGPSSYLINVTTEKKEKKSLFTQGKYVSLPSSVNIEDTSILSITHLNPVRKDELVQYVSSLSSSKAKVDEYDKTLEFHYDSQTNFNEVYNKLKNSKDLIKYGFRGVLRFGINTGQIVFQNYDKKKYREFRDYISKLVGGDMKRCEFTKKGSRYSLVLTLKSPERASKWLDKLVQDKDIKNFRIPNNESLKMKIDLVCVKPNEGNDKGKQEDDQ